GYARATGKVGVCLGTSGPAATNLVTGIATAQLDSIPMVAITGNVPAALLGKDAFQEIDITGITLPMTKHNYLVRDANDLPRVLAEAFHIARTGRPGPVHVDITKDALQQETDAPHPTDEEVAAGLPGFRPTLGGHPRQLKLIADEIAKAKRPIIFAGHGILIANATEELRALAEKARIPVAWTLLGIGAMDETHPLAYGYMGMHGWKHVNRAIQASDLIVAVGMRFDDRVTGNVRTYAPYARIVHVDIDPAEIGKNVAVDVPIVGDAKRVLGGLLPLVHEVPEADRAAYLAQLAEWRRESEGSSWHGSGAWRDGLLSADFVVAQIGEATGHDATIVADVGQNQMWTARYAGYRRPNSHLSSGGLGTMGYAVPAAMGAALGRPDKSTWAICGDGGFQMTIQELATLVQDRIPVRIALLDNHKLGMIRQWQEIFYSGNYHSSNMFGPDYLKLADAYGIPAWKVRTPEEVRPAVEAANAVDGPALVWFEIAEEQNVLPIMPAGKGLSDLIETWGGADE
ncbi:MAG: biosynthetic-type acetolactate synthase large subunit, partial [Chloroflexota bacterium]